MGSEWKSIESAPRDYSTVDLWVPERGRMTDMMWCVTSPLYPNGSWISVDQEWQDARGIEPTHWMRPPPPPETDQ